MKRTWRRRGFVGTEHKVCGVCVLSVPRILHSRAHVRRRRGHQYRSKRSCAFGADLVAACAVSVRAPHSKRQAQGVDFEPSEVEVHHRNRNAL
eukprot:2971394-Rhodomonas_salina.7